ncbi:MAG: DUF255 domain-containing protein [Acidobacteria bacterium]|nr:DUF255 domain-containing protein [Acidobacteriota bacterium]
MKALIGTSVLIVMGAVMALTTAGCHRGISEESAPPVLASHSEGSVDWTRSWDAAVKKARSKNRTILIDFYADWCIWCRRLDATTYRDPKVVAFLTDRVVATKLNVDKREGRSLSTKYHVDGLPTILLLSADGRELGRIPGYMPAGQFLDRLNQILGTASR